MLRDGWIDVRKPTWASSLSGSARKPPASAIVVEAGFLRNQNKAAISEKCQNQYQSGELDPHGAAFAMSPMPGAVCVAFLPWRRLLLPTP